VSRQGNGDGRWGGVENDKKEEKNIKKREHLPLLSAWKVG
jgi:hypothetical protein